MDCKDVSSLISFSPERMTKVSVCETPRLLCDLYCLEPGQEQRPHAHEGSDKTYFVLEGKGKFRIGSEERLLGEGMLVLAPAGSEHAVKNESDQRLLLLVFVAPPPKH